MFWCHGYSFSFLFYALMKKKQETSLLRSTGHATDPGDRQIALELSPFEHIVMHAVLTNCVF